MKDRISKLAVLVLVLGFTVCCSTNANSPTTKGSSAAKPTKGQESKDKDGITALMKAADAGDLSQVKALIADGADVNARDKIGMTPLMCAAMYGKPDCIKALIAAGGDVNASEPTNGMTVLILAAASGKSESIKALLDAGADATATSKRGQFASTFAPHNPDLAEAMSPRALLAAAQKKKRSGSQGPLAGADEYRNLTPEDNINLKLKTRSIGSSFGGAPTAEGVVLYCTDKSGKTKSIELVSTKLVDGKIETKQFGTILMGMATSGNVMFSATFKMPESQIKKLKTFLGF